MASPAPGGHSAPFSVRVGARSGGLRCGGRATAGLVSASRAVPGIEQAAFFWTAPAVVRVNGSVTIPFRYPRRLLFQTHDPNNPQSFNGWFCERCCWSVRLTEVSRARRVQQLFAQHDCEEFAQAHWKPPQTSG